MAETSFPTMVELSQASAEQIDDFVKQTSGSKDDASRGTATTEPDYLSFSRVDLESVNSTLSGGDPRCVLWDGSKLYADFIRDGLRYLGKDDSNVIMLFESPSSASTETSFHNCQVFPVHDYPPSDPVYKTVLGPLRYSFMNGAAYPSYVKAEVPSELLEHWKTVLPSLELPTFTSDLGDMTQEKPPTVYAYLPLEGIARHLNDPYVHYHLAGKDALHLMTPDTPKYLSNTKDNRPCIVKVTHSMGSKGIFLIENDEDEEEFHQFLATSGNPKYVITEFVRIVRNLSCHFFIHPNGDVTWFGSSENHKDSDGNWSLDSFIVTSQEDELRAIQYPYVRQVADYCLSRGFWGFGGVDVLIDEDGKGHVVDFNPRTTGTCPALMARTLLAKQSEREYPFGLFRRTTDFHFRGSAKELLESVEEYNKRDECKVVLLSYAEIRSDKTLVNIAVFGDDMEVVRSVIDRFDPLA